MTRRATLLFGFPTLTGLLGPAEAAPSTEVKHAMANGRVAVGVYRGSPSSIIEGATAVEAKGGRI
jgi:hypothetical protein